MLQSFGDRQVADQVLIRLHGYFPKARGAFAGYEMRRYSADAGIGGAYLAFGPGQMSRYWLLWNKPQDRLVFAGEHTEVLYPGTLEGALRTVIDPLTGQDWVSTRHLKSLTVHNGQVVQIERKEKFRLQNSGNKPS